MRKFLANVLFAFFIFPAGWLIDKIYPQGTQKKIVAWLDPDDDTKIRFQLASIESMQNFVPNKKSSTGMKIKDWENLVNGIRAQLIWRNNK